MLAVTWPMHGWFEERFAWLEKEFKIPLDDVIPAKSKYAVAGRWFLDDNLDNVLSWSAGNPGMRSMLWDTRATRDLGHDHLRVRSWTEVIDIVKSDLG